VPLPQWQDEPLLAEELDARKPQEAAPVAPQPAEELDGRKPPGAAPDAQQPAEVLDVRTQPEVAPVAEPRREERSDATGVWQRRPVVG
jgi:hypothetical protein